jgi:hypothetical protein
MKVKREAAMRRMLVLVLVMYSGAAIAQTNPPAPSGPPPTVGGQPLVQIKPKGDTSKKSDAAKKKSEAAKASHLPVAKRLQACLDIEDGTKGRLDCFDAIYPPKPNPKAPAAKGVADCKFTKEEDERLTCYNGFAEKIPKF